MKILVICSFILGLFVFITGTSSNTILDVTVDTILANLTSFDPLPFNDTPLDFNVTLGPVDVITFGVLKHFNLVRFMFENSSISGLKRIKRLESQLKEDNKYFIFTASLSCPNITFNSKTSIIFLSTISSLLPFKRFSIPLTINAAKTSFTIQAKPTLSKRQHLSTRTAPSNDKMYCVDCFCCKTSTLLKLDVLKLNLLFLTLM